jgi:hypothetical protein
MDGWPNLIVGFPVHHNGRTDDNNAAKNPDQEPVCPAMGETKYVLALPKSHRQSLLR